MGALSAQDSLSDGRMRVGQFEYFVAQNSRRRERDVKWGNRVTGFSLIQLPRVLAKLRVQSRHPPMGMSSPLRQARKADIDIKKAHYCQPRLCLGTN